MTGSSAVAWARAQMPTRLTWRGVGLIVVVVLYVLVTLGVVYRSPLLRLDTDLFKLDLQRTHSEWKPWVYYYVILGQRGPATLVFLPYFCWISWRIRSSRPLVMLATSLILLNLSVGAVKVITGREGPRQTQRVHEIFSGGDIFPSGHVSNAVVLYGLMAWIAIRYRKSAVGAAVFLSVTVGMGTVYLDTHWFSDVIGGWLAGALVLLILPTAMPYAQRWADAFFGWSRLRWRRVREPRSGDGRVGDAQSRTPRAGAPVAPAVESSAPGQATSDQMGTAARRAAASRTLSGAPRPPVTVRMPWVRRAQPSSTPVSSAAASTSRAATAASFDGRDEPTKRG